MQATDTLPRAGKITAEQLKYLNERAVWPWLKDALLDWAVMIGAVMLAGLWNNPAGYALVGVRALPASDPVRATLSLRDGRWRLAELLEPRPDLAVRSKEEIIYAIKTRLVFREENDFGQLVNWLEILDDCAGLGVTSLMHAKLIDIDEASLTRGAHIVCDLRKGKSGWHASRIHRVAD